MLGGDPADLSSTVNFNFAADGTNAVVLRFAPLGPALIPVHQAFFGINGFELDEVPISNLQSPFQIVAW